MSTSTCRTCGENFDYPVRRGRPPLTCTACKGEAPQPKVEEEKITASERVDRLEMMLRSRNLHVAQHTKEWE